MCVFNLQLQQRIDRDLALYEKKHSLRSAEFYEKFTAGQFAENKEFADWAGLYELHRLNHQKLKLAGKI